MLPFCCRFRRKTPPESFPPTQYCSTGGKGEQGQIQVRIKQGDNYPYFPAEVSANGKVKPVAGATYHLRYTEGGKRKLVSVGDDPAKATFEAKKKQNELDAQRLGLSRPVESSPIRIKMADAIAQHLT